jgi:hypothetical protein
MSGDLRARNRKVARIVLLVMGTLAAAAFMVGIRW